MERSLTIEKSGRVKADIETENIVVKGEMEGELKARDKITLHNGARMVGDISAPRIEIEDGAYYRGKIDMTGGGPTKKPLPASTTSSVTASVPAKTSRPGRG